MRKFPLLIIGIAALLAAPAGALAPKVGARTAAPEALLREMEASAPDAELEAAVAAASVHPLGTVQNPVRVGGPEGERAYIGRLRCGDGSNPKVGERAPAGVGAFGSVVAAYSLDCGAAAPGKARLVMDMYHEEHREDRAPAGFAISPR